MAFHEIPKVVYRPKEHGSSILVKGPETATVRQMIEVVKGELPAGQRNQVDYQRLDELGNPYAFIVYLQEQGAQYRRIVALMINEEQVEVVREDALAWLNSATGYTREFTIES